MTREELRAVVAGLWGTKLERPSLEQMRRDLLQLQAIAHPPPENRVYVLDETPVTYEQAMREFLAATLQDETGGTFVDLWLTAVELWLATMHQGDDAR